MNDFTMMHVFFGITALAVLVVASGVCIALWYILRILKTVDTFTKAALDEAMLLRSDIGEFRSTVRREGFKLKFLTNFFRKQTKRFTEKDTITK